MSSLRTSAPNCVKQMVEIAVQREALIQVGYDGIVLGTYRADLLVEGRLIVEVKTDIGFGGGPERQLRNYLRCSDIEVGILLVFGLKPRFKRRSLTPSWVSAAVATPEISAKTSAGVRVRRERIGGLLQRETTTEVTRYAVHPLRWVASSMADETAHVKERALADWFRQRGRVAIGFSGGVDSAYLAAIAVEALGPENCLALIGRSASLSGSEEDHAVSVAREIGIPIREIETAELADPRYAANPTNRCYFCKNTLWRTLVPEAQAAGFETVVDGTNADDLSDYRPGGRAAVEQGIGQPLARVGLTKAEIRELTRSRGWTWWDRPASPCLASRLPYGIGVTPERLRQVEAAESALRRLGVRGNLRVRHHGDLARVEMDAEFVARYSSGQDLESLVRAVADVGYAKVEVDPRGFRSGSLNVLEVGGGGAALSGH